VPSLVRLGFHLPPGRPKTLSFLFVCLSVRHAFERQSFAPDFAMKTLENRIDFDALDRGRFVVVHPCSTLSDCYQMATPLNAEVQNMAKIGFFFATRGRQNKPIETKFGT